NTVSAFDAAGKFIRKWGTPGSGPGELKNPAGIICDAGGNVIVVDSGNDRLQVFTPDGKALTQYGRNGNGEGEVNKPWGITPDNEGNIYVGDWKNHRVQKLSPSGEYHVDRQIRDASGTGECLRRDLSGSVHLAHGPAGIPQGGDS